MGVAALFTVSIGTPQTGTSSPQMDLGQTSALGTFLGGDSNGVAINSEVTLTNTMFAVPPDAGGQAAIRFLGVKSSY